MMGLRPRCFESLLGKVPSTKAVVDLKEVIKVKPSSDLAVRDLH